MYRQGHSTWRTRVIGQFPLRARLQSPGSLTLLLKAQYATFVVQPQQQGWGKPRMDEYQPLALATLRARHWVREVLLLGDGMPRVFAHTVVPRPAMRGAFAGLRHIGNRPLGAALFANPRIQRGEMRFCKLPRRHPWRAYMQVHAMQTDASQPIPRLATVWARRSVFKLGSQRLMVTEVFLPESHHGAA